METSSILFVVYAYKDKDLFNKISQIEKATTLPAFFKIVDQHPIDHINDFWGKDNCRYEYRLWDDINGPAYQRYSNIRDLVELGNHKYVCIVSPDIEFSEGWDLNLVSFLEQEKAVLSGRGLISMYQKDIFSIDAKYLDSDSIKLAQYIDKNFIFAKSEDFLNVIPPTFLKYYGENEYLTLSFLSQGLNIYSVPTNTYKDTFYRSVEKNYHTFSLEHNYNLVVDLLNGKNLKDYAIAEFSVEKFLSFHSIDISKINKLPYQTNDVNYDPYNLEMHKIDARRFVSVVKAVY